MTDPGPAGQAGDLPFSPADIRDLHSVFSRRVGDAGRIEIILLKIGLPRQRINFGNPVDVVWGQIFKQLENGVPTVRSPFRDLLMIAIENFPEDPVVKRLRSTYLPTPAWMQDEPALPDMITYRDVTGPPYGSPASPYGNPTPPPGNPVPPPGRRRWRTRTRLLAAGVSLAVVGTAIGIAVPLVARNDHGCSAGGSDVSLSWADGECVGYSDGSYQFGKAADGAAVQKAVDTQNRCAQALRTKHAVVGAPHRDTITLVYFAALTSVGTDQRDWTDDQIAELAGLLTWQRNQNADPNSADKNCQSAARLEASGPIVRVLIANGGSSMRFAEKVTREMLVPLARRDPTVLAVIGMDRSVDQVKQAIRELGQEQVAAVSTVLSADDLVFTSPYYLQIVPPNRRQALMIAMYAIKNERSRVMVVYPKASCDGGDDAMPAFEDRYLYTLVDDVRAEAKKTEITPVGGRSVTADLRGWDPATCHQADFDEYLRSWFAKQCEETGKNDLIFYAGRHEAFATFTEGMASCLDTADGGSARGSLVVADDTASRYVAANSGQSVVIRYVSKAPAVVNAGSQCPDGNVTFPDLPPGLPEFCRQLHDMYAVTGVVPPKLNWTEERVALAYVAAELFIDAVKAMDGAGRDAPERHDVLAKIRETVRPSAIGEIDFRTSQVAESSQLAILRINLRETDLPVAQLQADGGDIEDNPTVTCKYVISGTTPTTADCFGNPLSPLGKSQQQDRQPTR